MFKVGILGTENSHATGFSEIFNGYREDCREEFRDFRVTAVGGMYPEASRTLCEKYGIETVLDDPAEMAGTVDAVMVTARDGRYHSRYVLPFLEAGIPAFIDKPFTSNPQEAVELARLAKSRGIPLVGGSSLKLCADVIQMGNLVKDQKPSVLGGDVTAPVSLHNEYGGFWFYSAHLVEICLRVFGYDPEWVWATQTDKGITGVLHYPQYDVTLHFTDSAYQYSVTVNTRESILFREINITDYTLAECRSFAGMLRNGTMDFSYEQLVLPVFILSAIESSLQTGQKATIRPFII